MERKGRAGSGMALGDRLAGGGGEAIGDSLLASNRWYGPALTGPLEARRVRSLAHVTGGGIGGNLVRVLPDGARAVVAAGSWPRPPLFRWLMEAGRIPEEDARQAFN